MCKRIIFSGKTSLRQKVKALEKLFQEPNHRIEELKTKYGNKNKSPSRKTPSKEPAKAVIRLSNLGEKSTRGQSSEINPRSNNASLKTSQYFKQMMTTGSNKFTHLDTFTHGYDFAGNQGRFRQSDSWINTPTKYA